MNVVTTMDADHPLQWRRALVEVLGASLFLALISQIRVPLFFTPVPLSLQTLGLLLVGAFLGKKKGSLAVLAYLSEGALGLPVFAGGSSGFLPFAGPNGGFLIGFLLVAFLAGLAFEKCKSIATLTLGLLLAVFSVFLIGVPWLSVWVSPQYALKLGLYPFIIGDCLKAVIATSMLSAYRNWQK